MRSKFLFFFLFLFISVLILNFSCTKLDTTELGSDVLPEVDNVHTFADTLTVNTHQDSLYHSDSTVYFSNDYLPLGYISNDPLFGTTSAAVNVQLKPSSFPYHVTTIVTDTLTAIDSVVLCLSYHGAFGDTLSPLNLAVYSIDPNTHGLWDSLGKILSASYQPNLSGKISDDAQIDLRKISDTVKYAFGKGYSVNNIRIKMSSSWVNSFYNSLDSSSNKPFYSDSLYKRLYGGFCIKSTSPSNNSLAYIKLSDTATKLQIFYRKKTGDVLDTLNTALSLVSNTQYSDTSRYLSNSNFSNYIVRNQSGAQVANPNSNEIYIQTSPGNFASLTIPALSTMTNRIIHRAELIIEQIPGGSMDNIFGVPQNLYVDLKDTTSTASQSFYKPMYYDLNLGINYLPDNNNSAYPYMPSSIDDNYYGGIPRIKNDAFGNLIHFYQINMTRYVQHIVTNGIKNYDLRLFAPNKIKYPQYYLKYLDDNIYLGYGRIRVGSGTNPNYRMKMRIVYSKI